MFYFLKAKSLSADEAGYKLKAVSGFTLIEMLVVISIFLIMTGVILANFPAFRDKAALDLLAQEIATTIRQAQVYGIGTREAGTEFTSYGIYFDLNDTSLAKKAFYLYANRDSINSFSPSPTNCNLAASQNDCVVEKFVITGAAEIADLQGCGSSGCSSLNPNPPKLDIFFQRFYPEAIFPGTTNLSHIKIMLQSTRDETKKKEIQVWTTGQIVVANP